jgi:phenylalanyl-tRNA synthetase beta chain
MLAIVVTGSETLEDRGTALRELDFYDAKGMIDEALDAAGIVGVEYAAADVKHLRRGQSAAISVNGATIGSLGRLNDDIAASYKFKQPVYVAEINLSTALASPVDQIVYRPLAKYPGVVRDVSFIVPRGIMFKQIADTIVEQNVELCQSVVFVDIYEGKGLELGERSITIRLEYRSDERTLVESEIEAVHGDLVAETAQKLGIKTRY